MAKTFRQMVAEGREGTPMLSPQEVQRRMKEEPGTLVVDVRDADGLAGTGIIPGAINVSLGTLPLRADQELRLSPFMFLTALATTSDMNRMRKQIGGRRAISKDSPIERIIERIEAMLKGE